jgi:hypothetical protein
MPGGAKRDEFQGSHWTVVDGAGYIGTMAAAQASIPDSVTIADIRAMSRIGYRINCTYFKTFSNTFANRRMLLHSQYSPNRTSTRCGRSPRQVGHTTVYQVHSC